MGSEMCIRDRPIVLPFQRAAHSLGSLCANLLGLKTTGTNADRSHSDEFRPPEMSGPSGDPFAVSHEFMQGWSTGPQVLQSSIGNPAPANVCMPQPYTVTSPAIPQIGHQSHHVQIPNQVSCEDFVPTLNPTMEEQWEMQRAAGQSSAFYGLQGQGWKSECRAMGSAPAAFNCSDNWASFWRRTGHVRKWVGRGRWG